MAFFARKRINYTGSRIQRLLLELFFVRLKDDCSSDLSEAGN